MPLHSEDVISRMDLSRLIADAKGSRSYEQLSRDCGGVPTSKRLHQLVTAPLKNFPDPDTIHGLARGTGASERDVILAAARSLGLRVPDESSGVDTAGLTPRQADAVRSVVRAMLIPDWEAGETRGDTAPTKKQVRIVEELDDQGEGTVYAVVEDPAETADPTVTPREGRPRQH